MDPLYTAANCTPAYELRWSLALFASAPIPPAETWITALKQVVEHDGVRILESHFREPNTHQFLLSTKPHVTPPQIVKSVKGRLQHHLRHSHSDTFRRNFSLTSVGEARREIVESYVANQLGHHRMRMSACSNASPDFSYNFLTLTSRCRDSAPTGDISTTCIW